MDHHEDMESYLAVIQSHPECAFLWFLSDTPLTEKQQKLLLSCPNLMVSLPIDAPSTASMAKALRHQKTLFGMHKVYQDADAAAYLLSFDHLYSQMEQSVFFFLVADDSCSKESIRAVSDVVQQYRFTPIQPFFPIEVQEAPAKLSRLSPPIRRICCFCRITWPAHSIRPPFPLKSCLFGIYFTVNCSQMHKSTAKAEFYFFGSALAAIFLMIYISLLSVLRQTFPVPARFPWKTSAELRSGRHHRRTLQTVSDSVPERDPVQKTP